MTPEQEERFVIAVEKISVGLFEIDRSIVIVALILLFHALCSATP